MELLEVIRNRRSIRQYKPDPVAREVLEKLLETCHWAPSSSNTQPWHFAVIGGKTLDRLKERLAARVEAEWNQDLLKLDNVHPDIPYSDLRDPYLKRSTKMRNKLDSWQLPLGTPELDKKRAGYLRQGGRFYGAPNAIIIYTEKYLFPKVCIDIGIMAQTIAMAAHGLGLGTCLMAMPLNWPELVREVLGLPENKLMGLAIAIGYPETAAKVNTIERVRDPLNTYCKWYDV